MGIIVLAYLQVQEITAMLARLFVTQRYFGISKSWDAGVQFPGKGGSP